MKHIRFTQAGYDALKKEEEKLKKLRPSVVEDLKKAREMGDLSENGYYKASRQKLSFVDSSLRRIDYQLKYATIIESSAKDIVAIGCTVTLDRDGKQVSFEVVGDLEANPSEGKISLLSPLGKALANKKAGDTAEIKTPQRTVSYSIISIK
jgi:transcription elongation factor GreA